MTEGQQHPKQGRDQGGIRHRLQARLAGIHQRFEDRFFGVVYDLTRVTNDGSYQAMEDAAEATRQLPYVGRKRRGLRGG